MTGKSHTDPAATPFALAVMQRLNDACEQWKEETNIGFSVYGTPLESTTYKFATIGSPFFSLLKAPSCQRIGATSEGVPFSRL